MSMYPYRRPKYKRMKILSSIKHTFWSTVCLIGALALLALFIKWFTPWLMQLGNTIK